METISRNVKGISVQESDDMIGLCAKFTEDTIRHGSYTITVYGGRVVGMSSSRSIGIKLVDPSHSSPSFSRPTVITEASPLVHPTKGITKSNNAALLDMCKNLTDSRILFGSYTIEISGGKVSSVGFARSVKIEVVENETKPTAPQHGGNQADNTSEGKTL